MNDKFLAALRPYTLFALIFLLHNDSVAMNPNKPVGGFTIAIPLNKPNRDPWAPKNPFDRDTNGYPLHGSHLIWPSKDQNTDDDVYYSDSIPLDTTVSYCTKKPPVVDNNPAVSPVVPDIPEPINPPLGDEKNKTDQEPQIGTNIPPTEESACAQEIHEPAPIKPEEISPSKTQSQSASKSRQPRTPIDYYLASELKDYKPMGMRVKSVPKAKKSPSASNLVDHNSYRDTSGRDDSIFYKESALARKRGMLSFRPLNADNWQSLDNGGVYAVPSLVEKFKFYWHGTQQKEKKAYEEHIAHLQEKLAELTTYAAQEELYYQAKNRLLSKLQEDRSRFEHERQKKKECAERFAQIAKFQENVNKASQATIDNHVKDGNHQVSQAEYDAAYHIERSLFGKAVADESYAKNHTLEQARLEREKAELQRDLVLAAQAKAPYVWDPSKGKISALTEQEQNALADLLANIPENIEEIAEQAAQRVEIIKSIHPDYQGTNPPPSPNAAQRARAAMILRACKKAEDQKKAYVEHQETLQENQLLASLHAQAQDTRSGKKLVESLTSFVLQFFDGFKPQGPTNNPPSVIPNKNMVVVEGYGPVTVVHPQAEVKPNSALVALANRWFGGSGSGGSKEPDKSNAENKKTSTEDATWGFWSDLKDKVTIKDKQYAKINNRLYTRHAVDRMVPPRFGKSKITGYEGRGVPISVVEDVIANGVITDIRLVDGAERICKMIDKVGVVLEGELVITILIKGK